MTPPVGAGPKTTGVGVTFGVSLLYSKKFPIVISGPIEISISLGEGKGNGAAAGLKTVADIRVRAVLEGVVVGVT